jgi:diguanylate cyclase (GGDEF)-like protein/PAS domain S-box-containing protein
VDTHEHVDLCRLAAAQTSVGVGVASPAGVLRTVNPALASLVGASRTELIGTPLRDLVRPEDVDPGDLGTDGSDSVRHRSRFMHADGRVVHGDLTITPVRLDGVLLAHVVHVLDVSHEVRAQERLRGVIDTMLDPWVQLDAVRDGTGRIVDFVYVDANTAACRHNGVPYDELVGRHLLDLLPAHLDSGLLAQYAEVVETGTPLLLDDSPFPDAATGTVRYFDNRAVKAGDGISFTWRDVSARVEWRESLAARALRDPLTGLANRDGLLEAVETAFARAPRQGSRVAVLFCDVDDLKATNDTFGHQTGDTLLRAVAERMAAAVRRDDLVARIGGDEFVVVAPGITDDEAALALATKVADSVSRPLATSEARLLPRVSIGVAVWREGQTPSDVLAAADRALYRQKSRRGRTPD